MPQIKGNQINWNQVFYFSQIALHGSIKEAASHLGLSSSTLSEHLNQLEQDLKVELFFRQHRRLTLTPQGTRLFQHAKQMFEVGQRLIDVVSPIPLGCYPISVGIVMGANVQIVYDLLESYLAKYGPLSMKVAQAYLEDLEKGLVEAKFDFVFSDRVSDRKDIIPKLLSSHSLKFYVSPKWQGDSFKKLVEKLPLLISKSDSVTRSFVEPLFDELEINQNTTITSEYPALLHQLCEAGLGIGVFNESSIEKYGKGIREVKLSPKSPKLQEKLYILWAKDGENSESIMRLKELLDSKKIAIKKKFLQGTKNAFA